MKNVIVIAAAKAGSKKGSGSGPRSGRTKRRASESTSNDGSGRGSCTDFTARELACTGLLMWGNLVAVLIDAMTLAGVPRRRVHEVLDRLDRANLATLHDDGYEIASGFISTIRETLPSND